MYTYIYIYTNLPGNAIVTLPYPKRGDGHRQETFLAPSADKQTRILYIYTLCIHRLQGQDLGLQDLIFILIIQESLNFLPQEEACLIFWDQDI